MPSKIGATIALDGEKEYRAAVKSCNTEMKLLKSELKLASEQFSKNANSMKAYSQKQEILTKQVDQQKEKIATLRGALDDAKKKYGENSDQVKSWQMQLNSAEADLSKLNRELDDVKKHTTGVGKVKTEFEEIKGKIEQAKEKMEGFKKVLGGIGKAVKTGLAVGTAAVTAIGTASVAAGRQIWSMANEVSAAGDEIEKNSQKVGLSYASYQKWDYAMKISGTDMTSCANGLKTLTNKFDDAKNGSSGAVEIFNRLGLSVDDLKGKSREDVFGAVVKQLQNVTDETEKAALANDLFGKSGQNLAPMFNMTNEQLDELMNEAEKYGMVMSDEAVAASAAFQDSLTQLKGTMTGLKNEMIGKLLPSLTNLNSGLNEIVNGNPDEGIRMIKEAVSGLLDSIEELLPTLLQLGGEILQAISTSVLENLPMLVGVGTSIVLQLLQSIIGQADMLIEAALQLIEILIVSLGNNSDQLAGTAILLITKLVTGLLRMLPQLLEVGIELILALIEGLSDPGMLTQIITAALTCAGKLVEGLIRAVPQVLSAGVNLVAGLWQGITNSLDWLKNKIRGWVGNVMDFIKNLFGIHSPSSVMRDEVGKNLMLGIGAGIDAYAGIPQEAIDKATASLTATAGMTYQVGYIHDQIAASAPPTAMTYSGPTGNSGPGGGTPLETVISLLQIIAANSNKQIVLSDGTLIGWINAALGQSAADGERGVAI